MAERMVLSSITPGTAWLPPKFFQLLTFKLPMLRTTLAFRSRGLNAEPVTLYLGHDADKAREALKTAPADCVVARVYILGSHQKQLDLASFRSSEKPAKKAAKKAAKSQES